jgi:hypothetical protein
LLIYNYYIAFFIFSYTVTTMSGWLKTETKNVHSTCIKPYYNNYYSLSCKTVIRIFWSWKFVLGSVGMVLDFKPYAPHVLRFLSRKGLWILSCKKAIQLAYRMSVVLPLVPSHVWNSAWKGNWGLHPLLKLEICHLTYTVLVRHKIQPKNKIKWSWILNK